MDTFDIPGEYLHTEITKERSILMNLWGNFVGILCQVNLEYKQHVKYENGKKVLYLLVIRDIYVYI